MVTVQKAAQPTEDICSGVKNIRGNKTNRRGTEATEELGAVYRKTIQRRALMG
jgi:hypothetical protein